MEEKIYKFADVCETIGIKKMNGRKAALRMGITFQQRRDPTRRNQMVLCITETDAKRFLAKWGPGSSTEDL